MVDIVKRDTPDADAPKAGASPTVKPGEPTDPKARRTYGPALDWEKQK